ncbi:hypothetical protein [Arthrobacter sp. AQ5-05]|uniref:hypothetical protein n=1 Tax=Arthrobacter sp. AQ5-05 TaxID=2184581 RepID=UPI0018A79C1B|nr:hypothetical protein [Arthrobacter sp. AQ5-05]
MTALISTVVEAFSELRIHKTRVLLSLIGVALSVAVRTSVVGVGNLAREGMRMNSERDGGREATLSVSVYSDPMGQPRIPPGLAVCSMPPLNGTGSRTPPASCKPRAGFSSPRGSKTLN